MAHFRFAGKITNLTKLRSIETIIASAFIDHLTLSSKKGRLMAKTYTDTSKMGAADLYVCFIIFFL